MMNLMTSLRGKPVNITPKTLIIEHNSMIIAMFILAKRITIDKTLVNRGTKYKKKSSNLKM